MARGARVDPLSAAQRGKIRRLAGAASAPDEEAGELNVVPFLDILMNVLMFVLATLAVTFTSTVESKMSRPGILPPSQPTLGLTVIVVPGGFSLKARGGNVASGCAEAGPGLAVPRRDGAYDFASLRACAAKLKGTAPTDKDVIVSANPEIPYEIVIGALDAVRHTEVGDELFPEVSFAVAR